MNSIAITGIGVIAPEFTSLQEMAQACCAPDRTYGRQVEHITLPSDIKMQEQRRMSRTSRLALFAAHQASLPTGAAKHDSALFVSLTHGNSELFREFHDFLFDYGPELASPNAFSNGVTGAALGAVSKYLNLTLGGTTLVGYENGGLETLSLVCNAILDGVYPAAMVGGVEEYNSLVESAYAVLGWYPRGIPTELPHTNLSAACGYGVSEGAAFLACARDHSQTDQRGVWFTPVDLGRREIPPFDLVLSGAGGGPQDPFELGALLALGTKPVPVLFPKAYWGELFAAGSIMAVALAADMLLHRTQYPATPISGMVRRQDHVSYDASTIKSILVLSCSRKGEVTAGIVSRGPY